MTKIHPAIAGHVMEENERLRRLLRELREITSEYAWDADLEARVDAALSQQAEPECEWPTCECALEPERCKQAEPAPAAVPDSSDTFYAGLYKKSAPMWHRLHDLAVSKGYDHVRFAIECAPVYRCDCMGARKVAIDMAGNTIPCECVAAANEAEPVRCEYCDGTGDVHRADGEWLGECKECDAAEPALAQDELAVYRAVNQFGSDCHFGVESLARVWAGPKGTVERVTLKPAPDLSVVAVRPAHTEQQPVAEVAAVGHWERSLVATWPADEDDAQGAWIIGTTDEDGNRYEVITIEADQYDAPGDSEKIARALLKLWSQEFAAPIAQAAPQPSKAIAYRTLDRYGNPVTDWIDGDPAGGDPIVSGGSFQLAYGAPQPEQSGWIGVEDRLPPVRQILSDSCVLEGKEIPALYRSTDVICWDGKRVSCQIVEWFNAKMPISGVTHWMPLPAAPAQGSQL